MKLNRDEKKLILQAIEAAEKQTSGEIRVHISHAKQGDDLLAIAQKQFEFLKMHQTRERNGVLLYVNPKIRKFALYGDVGIHEKVGQQYWDQLREKISGKIRSANLTEGICLAVSEIGTQLRQHFPFETTDRNELQNDVSESD